MIKTIEFDHSWANGFLECFEQDGPWASWELYELALRGEEQLAIPTFEGLQAPKHLANLTPLPHQLEVAKQVVEEMNGKAILADEVGLGKTIEAGLILKEYMIRGLVRKALILVPASLVSQWTEELNSKFHIPAIAYKKSYNWSQVDCVVTSLDMAKRGPHREQIYEQNYDLVIVDEAHKLKNPKTKNYEFVQNLKKKFCLLLTTTPIQNRIDEIFHLVSLLKPGHLGTQTGFLDKYKQNKTTIHDDQHLRELINKVMVRNRREDTKIQWKKRHVKTIPITFSDAERALYEEIEWLKQSNNLFAANAFSLLTLKREACSSKEAVYFTLKNMLAKQENPSKQFQETLQLLMSRIEKIEINSKAEQVLKLIKQINDKVIIFTEYRATQLYLQWFLKQHGISSVPFRGGFKRGKKDWMRQLFQNQAQVLIATEAGGEGINLQFCHHMINFDLPWNPMRLEQRIGRIHRLGQEQDVYIYNLMIKGTIEEHILTLLYEKIRIFERVIGELDDILTRLDFGNLEEHFLDIFTNSHSEGEMNVKINNLSEMIQLAEIVQKEEDSNATGRNSSIS